MPTQTPILGLYNPLDADDANTAVRVWRTADNAVLDAAVGTARQNLLTNPGFEVNQRAGTVTAANAYAHDRWQNQLGGTSTVTITDETAIVDTGSAHALKAVYVHGAAVSRIDQKLETFAQLRGRTVTFAVRVRKGVASSVRPYVVDSGVLIYGATDATTGAYTTMSVTATIGAAATSVSCGVEASASDTYYLDSATLTVGGVPLGYAPLGASEEWTRCARYCLQYGGGDALEWVASGQVLTPTQAAIVLVYPVEMAVVPTLILSAAADWAITSAAGGAVACTALTLGQPTRRTTRLIATVGAGLVAGNGAILWANGTTNARLRLEANP